MKRTGASGRSCTGDHAGIQDRRIHAALDANGEAPDEIAETVILFLRIRDNQGRDGDARVDPFRMCGRLYASIIAVSRSLDRSFERPESESIRDDWKPREASLLV